MGIDYQALLEAMEQQRISIAKGGIICCLSARAAVIAASNPVGGHYNKNRSICENLKIKDALVSTHCEYQCMAYYIARSQGQLVITIRFGVCLA